MAGKVDSFDSEGQYGLLCPKIGKSYSTGYGSRILADKIHSEFSNRKGGVSLSFVIIRRRFMVNAEWLSYKGILSIELGQ
jgi:hypothetical protein